MTKQFYVSISDVVKKILEGGYGVQTAEKTTAEIMEEMHRAPFDHAGMAGQQAEFRSLELIESLLTACDLVKFAKYIPPQDEGTAAIDRTFRLLENCRKLKATLDSPESAAVAGVA